MVKVAVAGGTSPLAGRAIVEALIATKGKHEVVILSRNEGNKYGARIIAADYSDERSLTEILEREKIHTLISVLRLDDLGAMLTVHKTLLDAAYTAGVSRFILSDWAMGPLSTKSIDVNAHKDDLHDMGQKAMVDARHRGGHMMECCTMQNGWFMEYFIVGSEGSWFDDPFFLDYIDVKNGKLIEPCHDDMSPSQTTLTSLKDIGRFVAAAMDLGPGKLVGRIGMSGQVLPSYGHIANILKAKCGMEVKLQKVTPSDCDRVIEEAAEKIRKAEQKGEFDLQSLMAKAAAQMVKVNCEGEKGGAVVEAKLNELCPQIKPVQVEEMLVAAWEQNRQNK